MTTGQRPVPISLLNKKIRKVGKSYEEISSKDEKSEDDSLE